MNYLKKLLSNLSRFWDPRPILAKEWLESAENYEKRLRSNQSLNLQVVESVLKERNRIHTLFSELLPEFSGKISIVITKNAHSEHCAIFSWNDHLYVLVSAALIGRPYDHPEDTGIKAWEWLARHEIAHIKGGHLSWFFHTRRLFKFTFILCCIEKFFLNLFPSNQALSTWLELSLWLLGTLWLIQTIIGLTFEWQADLTATYAAQDPIVLKEAEKSLHRMTTQPKKHWFGWIQYAISLVFLDPHPPFAARRYLLRKRLLALENAKKV